MERFISLIKNIGSLTTQEYIILGSAVLLFVALFAAFFFFVSHIIDDNVISGSISEYYEKTKVNAKQRKVKYEQELNENGYQGNEPLLGRLDKLIENSGINRKLKFLNADVFVLLTILVSTISFIVVALITGEVIYGLITLSFIVIILVAILLYLNNLNKKRVEEELINFINLIENYSKTSDDIIHIIGRVFPYIDEPIKSAAEECYLEGQRTGNVSQSLDNFAKKINHKRFREIIRSLSICSRYEANYSDVADDSRRMLMEYLAGKQEREAIVRNARIEVLAILGLAFVMVYMLGGFIGENVLELLMMNFLGKIILLFSFIVVLITLVSLILMGRGND